MVHSIPHPSGGGASTEPRPQGSTTPEVWSPSGLKWKTRNTRYVRRGDSEPKGYTFRLYTRPSNRRSSCTLSSFSHR